MNLKACVAEFVGTFALIFVGVGAIAANHGTANLWVYGVGPVAGALLAALLHEKLLRER